LYAMYDLLGALPRPGHYQQLQVGRQVHVQ
jgi:hypothetical protein